ncbi:uncharacterized protein IL334_006444 [Kwoniella shivajii]|uniref:SET domain-containing protein n=1 Tax=Kwoniella shivajii TaxID=564305 RepID=A0ABZ1D5Z3_9TREE|nr:hypothetical protein IL334_006444 [Kwoniella shivajii]
MWRKTIIIKPPQPPHRKVECLSSNPEVKTMEQLIELDLKFSKAPDTSFPYRSEEHYAGTLPTTRSPSTCFTPSTSSTTALSSSSPRSSTHSSDSRCSHASSLGRLKPAEKSKLNLETCRIDLSHQLPTPPGSESPISSSFHSPSQSHIFCYLTTMNDIKGVGLVASGYIKKGTLIVKQSPLLTVTMGDINEVLVFDHVYPQYFKLPKNQRDKVMTFHRRTDQAAEKDELVNIIETNAIPLQGDPSEEAKSLGLFETIGKINHSCAPNSGWSWYEEGKMLHLYAYDDISPGSEITVSYIQDVTAPCLDRQQELLSGHGFLCICSACCNPTSKIIASDRNLEMYQILRNKWLSVPIRTYAFPLTRALRDLDLALDILGQEKKVDGCGEVYDLLFEAYAIHGRKEEAKNHARKALRHYSTVWGAAKAEKYTEYKALMADPSLYVDWASLRSEDEWQENRVKRMKLSGRTIKVSKYSFRTDFRM